MPRSEPKKPTKPRADFPLFPHATGRWAKKIRGKLVYFGNVADDPDGQAALVKYLDQKDDLQAGRKPRDKSDGLTVRDLVNRFLTAKRHLIDTRELSAKTFTGYRRTCLTVAEVFGRTRAVADLRADDFEALRRHLAKTRGPVALGNEIRHVRILFKYAYDAGLIDVPIRFGPTFKAPSKRVLRQARQAAGPRMFEADELRRILDAAGRPIPSRRRPSPTGTRSTAAARHPMRAMILLGINCGFGQTDVATLPRSAVNLESGWLDFPRPKTAVPRRVPLWPETVEALAAAFAIRPKPKDKADDVLAFLTRQGRPWVRMREKPTAEPDKREWSSVDSVALLFGDLLASLDLKRPGLSFYGLRHTFRTIADESRDQPAVNAIMGHDDGSMASLYRERIADERLRAVVDHVRRWLFA